MEPNETVTDLAVEVANDEEGYLAETLGAFARRRERNEHLQGVASSGAAMTMVRAAPLQIDEGAVPTVSIGTKLPGEMAWVAYRVPTVQLRPDVPSGLRSSYDPTKDLQLADLISSIQELGQLEPLDCIYRGETTTDPTSGEQVPLIRIKHGKRRWFALMDLARRGDSRGYFAEIRIDAKQLNDGQHLLAALTQQVNRKDLNLYDLASSIHRLVHEYGFYESVVGAHIGMSQSRISRYADAGELAERSEVMADYMRDDSLKLEHVARMTLKKYAEELETLALVAEYAVQMRCSGDRVEEILKGLLPDNGIDAYYAIVRNADGTLTVERLVSTSRGSPPPIDDGDHFWKRARPVLARPERIARLSREVDPVISGTAKQPLVAWQSLGLVKLLADRLGLDDVMLGDELGDLFDFLEHAQADIDAVYRVCRANGMIADDRSLATDAASSRDGDAKISSLQSRRARNA